MASKKKTLLKPKRTKHTTLLTEEKAKEVKRLIIEGKTLRECADIIKVNHNTLYQWKWDNTLGFADMVEKAEAEAELKRVQEFSKRLLQYNEVEEGKVNTSLLAIKQREASDLRGSLINAKRIYDNRQVNNTVVVLPTPILGGMLEKEAEVIDEKE